MTSCCCFLKLLLIALCILLPLLWIISHTFRYYVKITIFYVCIFVVGQLSALCVLPKFGDPLNYRYVQMLFIGFTRWLNIKWELRGMENIKSDQPFVVVCNHQSSLDLVGMMETWPFRCVSMMKSSMKYLGFLGISAMGSGSVFIERYNKESAIITVNKAVKQIQDSGVKIWVFPEGTRNHESVGLLPFKKGAFHLAIQAKIPIVPMVFSSYKCFYDRSEHKFLSDGFVIAEALEPIKTDNLTVEDVTKLSVETREKMLKVLEKNSIEAAQRYEKRDF